MSGAARSHWRRAELALALLCVATLALHQIVDTDLFWQLATAKQILATGLPETDPYSYAFPGRPWIELRWLYYLGAWAIAQPFGLNGLLVAKLLCLLACFALLAGACHTRHAGVTAFSLLGALLLMHSRLGVRPELLSFLWLALLLLCLDRVKRGGSARWLAALPLLQLLWNNTHTLGILGPVLTLSLAASEWIQARLAGRVALFAGDPHPLRGPRLRLLFGAGALQCLAGFATPYGLAGALYPFQLILMISSSSPLSRMIAELHSPLYYPGWHLLFAGWLGFALVSGLSFWLRPERFVLARLVWWMGFLHLAALSTRNIALFGIVAAAVLAANLRDALDAPGAASRRLARALPGALRAASLGGALLLLFATVTDRFWRSQHADQSFGTGLVARRFPVRALSFAIDRGLPLPPLGDLASGGYFLYRLGPRSTLIDGRLEVYGEKILVESVRQLEDPRGFLALARRHRIDTAILDIRTLANAISALASLPDWRPVYYDSGFAVFVRHTPETAAKLETLALDLARDPSPAVEPPAFDAPVDWLAGAFPRVPDAADQKQLGYFFLLVGQLERARDEFGAGHARAPDDLELALHLAVVQHALGERDAAARLFAALPAELGERSELWELRAQLAARRGAPEEAYEFLQRALALEGGDTPERRAQLANLAQQLGRSQEALRWQLGPARSPGARDAR